MNITLQNDYILPAEWYEQSGVMLTWPHESTDWKPYLKDITETYLEITRSIAKYEHVIIVTPHLTEVRQLILERLGKEILSKIIFYNIDSNDTWARDHGPITLVSERCAKGYITPIHLLNFRFNGWGEKYASEKDNAVNMQLYHKGAFYGAMDDYSDFVLEGGSIESDGKGNVFTTSQCLMAPHRNQPLNKNEIESLLKKRLHASRIIWLDYGNLIGDDTDGHIDTIVRLAPNDKILYVGAGNNDDEQHDDFIKLEQQLNSLRTSDGKPYNLYRLPMPDAIYDEGERLPATYANFLIINKAVICPTYNQKAKDQEALQTIQECFPDREIIGIDSRTIIRQHGSIHCLTMQLPAGALKLNNT